MAEVKLSAAARADLVEIRRYSLGRFGAATADRYLRDFGPVFDRLAERPMIGVAQPELGPAVRRVTYGSHRIFYRPDGETVRIMRILHHARNLDRTAFDR